VNTVVAGALLECATEEQVKRWVPSLLDGEKVAFVAFTERSTGSDPGLIQTPPEPCTAGWRITGTKRWITNAQFADVGVVFAREPEGNISLFLVPTELNLTLSEREEARQTTKGRRLL
jgi:alkylation response protein AidB-like acyl-CoA dehydrogenase